MKLVSGPSLLAAVPSIGPHPLGVAALDEQLGAIEVQRHQGPERITVGGDMRQIVGRVNLQWIRFLPSMSWLPNTWNRGPSNRFEASRNGWLRGAGTQKSPS